MRRHVQTLLEHLDSNLFVHSLAAPDDVINALAENLSPSISVERIEIGDKVGSLSSAGGILFLARKMRAMEVDLAHAHGYRAAIIAVPAARIACTTCIFTAHNMFPRDSSKAARLGVVLASRLARAVIAVSPAVKRSLVAAGVQETKVKVIPNGIAIPEDCGRPANLTELKLHEGAEVILCVARLTEIKGVRFLIEAAPQISLAVPEARIMIAGDGPENDDLVELASSIEANNVDFLGYRSDVPELLRLADVVVIPSLEEAQSLVLAEAMALARPVVASSVGGMADIIQDGVNGISIPPRNPRALAEAVVAVLTDKKLAASLGARARRYAESHFDLEVMLERTRDVYIEVSGR